MRFGPIILSLGVAAPVLADPAVPGQPPAPAASAPAPATGTTAAAPGGDVAKGAGRHGDVGLDSDTTIQLGLFVGGNYLGPNVSFNSALRDRYVGTSPELGFRLGYYFWPAPRETPWSGGIETEFAMTPTWTQTGNMADSPNAYFSPYLAGRAHVILRVGDHKYGLHVLGGGGFLTVVSKAPFVPTETSAQGYLGGGFDLLVRGRNMFRLDFRDVFMGALNHNGLLATYEMQVGVTHTFGGSARHHVQHEDVVVTKPAPPKEDPKKDSDGDGFPDSVDKCPFEPETVNGFQDDDGCPEGDRDGDGILDAKDKCPDQPEDRDHFQDEDGCPDPDNDGDGILDKVDVCPNDPETFNGFQDDDGCPDEVPAPVKDALSAASKVKFEANKPKIAKASAASLNGLVAIMQAQANTRIVIIGHPEKANDTGAEDLAKKRAEAVRFFLEDKQIPIVRADVLVGDVATKGGPLVEVRLFVAPPKSAPAAGGLRAPPE